MVFRFLLVLVLAFLAVGCSGGSTGYGNAPVPTSAGANPPVVATTTGNPTAVSGEVDVTVQNFAFSPATITVKAGTTVRWTQKDSTTHTVTSDNGVFDSKNLAQGQTFTYTFSTPGTYNYHCSIHSYMTGTVIVQ